MTREELISEWRATAIEFENDAKNSGVGHETSKRWLAIADTFNECADDLESLTYEGGFNDGK